VEIPKRGKSPKGGFNRVGEILTPGNIWGYFPRKKKAPLPPRKKFGKGPQF